MMNEEVQNTAGHTLDTDGHISEEDLEHFTNTCIEEGALGFGQKLFDVVKHISGSEEPMSEDEIKEKVSEHIGKDINDGATMEGFALQMCEEYQVTPEMLDWLMEQVQSLDNPASVEALAAIAGAKPEDDTMEALQMFADKCTTLSAEHKK